MTKIDLKTRISLSEDYFAFMSSGAEPKHKNFYYSSSSDQYIEVSSIRAFCPLYRDEKTEALPVPLTSDMNIDYSALLYNMEFFTRFCLSDLRGEFKADYLPIAYSNEFAPICLGIAPGNRGKIFLYEFDNIEYRAGSIIGDPEEGNFEVEECESYKFHELADSFSGFIAGLVDDETLQYVPQIFKPDMRDYFGDARGFSATQRLMHYSSAAKELAEARKNVTFSYLDRLEKQRKRAPHYEESLAQGNNKLQRELREFEEYASMPFYRKIVGYFAMLCRGKRLG